MKTIDFEAEKAKLEKEHAAKLAALEKQVEEAKRLDVIRADLKALEERQNREEKALEEKHNEELDTWAKGHGYRNYGALIAVLEPKPKVVKPAKTKAVKAKKAPKAKKRHRAKVTPELRERVAAAKALQPVTHKTARQIATEHGVSLSFVNRIKPSKTAV